jgi:hypothetical protein
MQSQKWVSAKKSADEFINSDINKMHFDDMLHLFDDIFYESEVFDNFFDCNFVTLLSEDYVYKVFAKLVESEHFTKFRDNRTYAADEPFDETKLVIGINYQLSDEDYRKLKKCSYEFNAYAEQGLCDDEPSTWNIVRCCKPFNHPEIEEIAKYKINKLYEKEIEDEARELAQMRMTVPENVQMLLFKYRDYPKDTDVIDYSILQDYTKYDGINYFANHISGNAEFSYDRLAKFLKKHPKFAGELEGFHKVKIPNRAKLRRAYISHTIYKLNKFIGAPEDLNVRLYRAKSKIMPILRRPLDQEDIEFISDGLNMLDILFKSDYTSDKFLQLYNTFIHYFTKLCDNHIHHSRCSAADKLKDLYNQNIQKSYYNANIDYYIETPLNILLNEYHIDYSQRYNLQAIWKNAVSDPFDKIEKKIETCRSKFPGQYECYGITDSRQTHDKDEIARASGEVINTGMHHFAGSDYGADVYEIRHYGIVERYNVSCFNHDCQGRPKNFDYDSCFCKRYMRKSNTLEYDNKACLVVGTYKSAVPLKSILQEYLGEIKILCPVK